MSFKIGFTADAEEYENVSVTNEGINSVSIRKSLVKVYFEARNAAYSYYNDRFDLKTGDRVWVEGKLEGVRGRVIDISYNFKIKLSDYKRVIGVVNTDVAGKFRSVGPYFLTDRAYPDTFKTWFIPPEAEEEEIVTDNDGSSFNINDLSGMHITKAEAQRGSEYFDENRVAYIGISGGHGTAIVEGRKPYSVEFDYNGGEIRNLTCECYDIGACRHEFAAMLVLKEIIDFVEKNYKDVNINRSGFSAVRKSDFFRYVVDSKNTGTFDFE